MGFISGDEILVTNHQYNACRNAVEFVAHQTGAQVKIAPIPLPIQSSYQVLDVIFHHISDATKLVLIDHVTSPTALIFPVKMLVKELNHIGIKWGDLGCFFSPSLLGKFGIFFEN